MKANYVIVICDILKTLVAVRYFGVEWLVLQYRQLADDNCAKKKEKKKKETKVNDSAILLS